MDTQKELHHTEPDDGNEMSEEVSSSKEVVADGATDEDEDAEGEDEEDENDGEKEKDEGEKEEDEREKEEEEDEKDEIENEMETTEKKKPDVDMEKGKNEVAYSCPIIEDDLVNDEDFMKEMDNNMMNALRDADSDI